MGRTNWFRAAAVGVALGGLAAIAAGTPLPAAASDPLVYVALGDSYTSGPLVLPHDTRWVTQDCGQSYRNYPHLAAPMMKADEFRDVSCGAATIDDFEKPQTASLGQPNKPQFDALTKDVDVITVGIGGNDVGFVGLAVDCVRTTPTDLGSDPDCTPQNFDHGVDKVSRKIQATAPELAAAIQRMHQLSPHAAVFIVGYPTALPDDGKACWPYMPIRQTDMPYLVAKFKEMNAMLKTTAEGNGATYVDIYTSSIGHDACKPPALAWINGIVLVPPSYPAHPNDFSFLHSAPVVAQAVKAKLASQASALRAPAPTTSPSTTAAPAVVRGALLPRTGRSASTAFGVAVAAAIALVVRRRIRAA
jgi:hypothetical protein